MLNDVTKQTADGAINLTKEISQNTTDNSTKYLDNLKSFHEKITQNVDKEKLLEDYNKLSDGVKNIINDIIQDILSKVNTITSEDIKKLYEENINKISNTYNEEIKKYNNKEELEKAKNEAISFYNKYFSTDKFKNVDHNIEIKKFM
jgi:hypothetical protein